MFDASLKLKAERTLSCVQRQQAEPKRDVAAAACIAKCTLLRLGDLVAYDTANRRAGRCSQEAAAHHIACDSADDGPSGSALLLR